jgi:hypothetical protein
MLSRMSDALNPGRSLAAKLTLAIMAVSLALSLLISLVIGRAAEQQAEAEIGALHADYAQRLADELDADIDAHRQNLAIIAGLVHDLPVGSPVATRARRDLLEQIQTAYPEYAWLGLLDAGGHVLAGTHGVLEGRNIAQAPWFGPALQQPYVGDVRDDLALAAQLLDGQNTPERFLDVAAPVRDDTGMVIGVLAGELRWRWVRDIQQKILAPLQGRRSIDLLIEARDGRVLLGPAYLTGKPIDPAGAVDTANGYQIARWADGNDYLTGFARGDDKTDSAGLGWTILVREPPPLPMP